MKNSIDTISNLTHDLTVCSAVPQLTGPPRAPSEPLCQDKLRLNYVRKLWHIIPV